jgi:hypothetical protein
MPRSKKPPREGGLSEVSGEGTPVIVDDRAASHQPVREVFEIARTHAAEADAESCGDLVDEVFRLVHAAVEALNLLDAAGEVVLRHALERADRRLGGRRSLITEWRERGRLGAEVSP